jgi:hypothetical protein
MERYKLRLVGIVNYSKMVVTLETKWKQFWRQGNVCVELESGLCCLMEKMKKYFVF